MLLRRGGLWLFLLVLLTGCGDPPATPEERIKALLATAERAVEAREIGEVMAFVSSDYTDSDGHDKKALLRLVGAYLLRHKSIHLLTQINRIDLQQQDQASVTLFAAMSGRPLDTLSEAINLRLNLYRFELEMRLEQGDWKLVSGRWRPAGPKDFLE